MVGYKGKVISDWGLVMQEYDPINGVMSPKGASLIQGALTNFMRQPTTPPFRRAAQAFAETGDRNAAIQAFGSSADFPASVLEVMDKYHQTLYFDTAYEQVFDILDMRNSRRNGFKITDVTSGLTFAKVLEGEAAKLFKMSGQVTEVTLDMYGGGLHWSRRLFDDEEYWTLEDNAIEFRNKAYESKASDYYALIDAVGAGINLAWQAVDGAVPTTNENYIPIRDINTINKACEEILLALRNLGMGITVDSEFIILAPIQLKARIQRALGLVQQPFAGSTQRLIYNVRPLYTLMLSATDVYYVIFPKKKIKGANRMDLTIFTDFDPTRYTELAVGWQRYGGAIGQEDQLRRCSTA